MLNLYLVNLVLKLLFDYLHGSGANPPSPHIVQNSRELSVKGVSAPPLIGGLPSTGGPGCAISRRRGYILQSRTLSHDWERAGDWVEHERRFTYELYQQSLRAYEERDPAQSSPHPAEGTGRNALCGVFLLARDRLCFLLSGTP